MVNVQDVPGDATQAGSDEGALDSGPIAAGMVEAQGEHPMSSQATRGRSLLSRSADTTQRRSLFGR